MTRPSVDVVLPFAGRDDELEAILARLGRLRLRDGDRVLVADNRPRRRPVRAPEPVEMVAADGERSPAYARNRAAAAGSAEWLVFLDADVEASPDLLDRYFQPPPGPRTAVLAGDLRTAAGDGSPPAAARYARARGFLDARRAAAGGRWAFAQTANCAVRRAAFEAVGGFTEGIRAGEDADLCWRLAAAGWGLEPRPEAWAVHIPRQTVRGLIGQMLVHGAAHSWLERAWPGSTPPRSRPGLAVHSARRLGQGLVALGRRDPDGAITGLLDPVAIGAFEAGRLRHNRARRARR
jgi:mycofactocin glycosyltransferase